MSEKVIFHLPGLFEFYDFYKVFLPLYFSHREFFHDRCSIGSVYGAPEDCIWGGGREGIGDVSAEEVLSLINGYGISARLTFSNSLLKEEHLSDKKCNNLCRLFAGSDNLQNGVIIHSDLLLEYLQDRYPELYPVSSTTKVLTDFGDFRRELERDEFKYAVPDFRLNKRFEDLSALSPSLKDKVEFLCNECCFFGCSDRSKCYEEVSRRVLGLSPTGFICPNDPDGEGYLFSKAMKNPGFISYDDIVNIYCPMGFSNFKIEGRGLGSALILEFILYYMTRPEYRINLRELVYLDNTLDLF